MPIRIFFPRDIYLFRWFDVLELHRRTAVTVLYEPARDSVSAGSECSQRTSPSATGNTSGPPVVGFYAHIGEKIALIALNTTYAPTITVEALTAETFGYRRLTATPSRIIVQIPNTFRPAMNR